MKTLLIATIVTWSMALNAADTPATEVKKEEANVELKKEQAKSEVQKVKENVNQQLEKLSPQEPVVTIDDLKSKYDVQALCESSLSKEECNQGLRTLDQALANNRMKKENCKCLNTLSIVVSPLGKWQAATEEKREIRVPYNVETERMNRYINRQIAIVFVKEDQDIANITDQIEKDLESRYSVVAKSGAITVRQYYEGLKNVYIIFQRAFGDSPNKDDIQSLGYDGIIVSNENKSLYEDNGNLLVKVDYRAPKGEVFQSLIHQVRVASHWQRVKSGTPFSSTSTWSIHDVRAFRASRNRVEELTAWLKQKLPNTEVKCILAKADRDNVTIAQCEQGLSNLQRAMMSRSDSAELVGVSKLLIANTSVRDRYKVDENTVGLSFSISPNEILPVTQNP